MHKINFCSGPAVLPPTVYNKAIEAIQNFDHTDQSILELSHRSSSIVSMIQETKLLVKELLAISDEYDVLFLHGGASMQFCMIPMNFLSTSTKAYYTLTGQWASNAFHEAQLLGNADALCSSADSNYNYLPSLQQAYTLDNSAYVHFTSNNTIYGTQWKSYPSFNCPIIVDMSSDLFSKKINVHQFDLIYAGAQKNIGIAGVCMVIIKKSLLEKQNKLIPTMLNYNTHLLHESSFNTPPVFAIYTCNLNLKWLKSIGGVQEIEKINQMKAQLLYAEIERNSLFDCTVAKPEDRSLMNVTFVAKNKEIEIAFKDFCKKNNIVSIDGYRTVGGFRASIYNAMPLQDVQLFVEIMKSFESKI
ncbi:MAG: 3-phosphoserine/phosphohydroxythreonine transaminase [Bacteroidota bacterium]